MYYESRHKFELYLLVVSIAVTILAGEYWKFFFIWPTTVFMIYISDVLFLSHNMFMYEPNF